MCKIRYQDRAQLVLALEPQGPRTPLVRNPKGLVETLADLLLEALGAEPAAQTGGADEREDHA